MRSSRVPSRVLVFPFVCSELLGWAGISEFLLVSCANKNGVMCITGAQQIFVQGTNKQVTQECSRRNIMSVWPVAWTLEEARLQLEFQPCLQLAQ